jgi:hypothetical protein
VFNNNKYSFTSVMNAMRLAWVVTLATVCWTMGVLEEPNIALVDVVCDDDLIYGVQRKCEQGRANYEKGTKERTGAMYKHYFFDDSVCKGCALTEENWETTGSTTTTTKASTLSFVFGRVKTQQYGLAIQTGCDPL